MCNTREKSPADEARKRLLSALPYLRKAAADARQNGKMMLGILSVQPGGGGQIEAQLEADSFFDDLALVIGAPPQSEADDLNAQALRFLDKHGLRGK